MFTSKPVRGLQQPTGLLAGCVIGTDWQLRSGCIGDIQCGYTVWITISCSHVQGVGLPVMLTAMILD